MQPKNPPKAGGPLIPSLPVAREAGRVVSRSPNRPTYKLEALLAQSDPDEGLTSPEDRAWLFASAVGRELI